LAQGLWVSADSLGVSRRTEGNVQPVQRLATLLALHTAMSSVAKVLVGNHRVTAAEALQVACHGAVVVLDTAVLDKVRGWGARWGRWATTHGHAPLSPGAAHRLRLAASRSCGTRAGYPPPCLVMLMYIYPVS
jgi:hypothetical protein